MPRAVLLAAILSAALLAASAYARPAAVPSSDNGELIMQSMDCRFNNCRVHATNCYKLLRRRTESDTVLLCLYEEGSRCRYDMRSGKILSNRSEGIHCPDRSELAPECY
ncbi:hypothetical protein BKA62DRAFT_721550 [Auriculariales sp. MPI-PUGE-AT-0066]|nr:hypothetical protein BKA62DRAFT_721550 [Auriculariales sp. MPI-PUGE-AT-0066]